MKTITTLIINGKTNGSHELSSGTVLIAEVKHPFKGSLTVFSARAIPIPSVGGASIQAETQTTRTKLHRTQNGLIIESREVIKTQTREIRNGTEQEFRLVSGSIVRLAVLEEFLLCPEIALSVAKYPFGDNPVDKKSRLRVRVE